MAGEKHLRLTVSGAYVGTGLTTPEVWAFNIRQALVFGSIDPTGTFPTNWTVAAESDTTVDTHWTLERSYRIDGPGSFSFDPSSYLNDYVCPSLVDFMACSTFWAGVVLREAALYPCATTGNSIDHHVAKAIFTTDYNGGGGSNPLPTENTVAVSWDTARRGPRGRGRIFTPVPTRASLGSFGEFSSGSVSELMTRSKNLIEGLAFHGTGIGAPSVESVVTGPASSGGMAPYSSYAVIDGLRVGDVVDTQRRRRNKEAENYQSDTISQ